MSSENYVITIGRQMGSGGADMGKAISQHFGFHYIDREILIKASKQLNIPEENLEWIEEKNFSIWGALLQSSVYELPYITEEWYMPTGRQLYETQSQIIRKAAKESSCIVVGRCGSYLFRNHPRHVSLFFHASEEHRMERLKDTLKVDGEKAKKALERGEKERSRYFNTYTGEKWLDLTGYDLVIDTGKLAQEDIKDLLFEYIKKRFPELKTTT